MASKEKYHDGKGRRRERLGIPKLEKKFEQWKNMA